MAETPDGNIWIGTSDRGLCFYNYQTGHINQFPYTNKEYGYNGLIDLTVLTNDSLIFITSDQLVLFVKNDKPHYVVISNSNVFPEDVAFFSLNKVRGKLKIGTSDGDFDFSISNGQAIITPGIIEQQVYRIIESEMGLLAASGFFYCISIC